MSKVLKFANIYLIFIWYIPLVLEGVDPLLGSFLVASWEPDSTMYSSMSALLRPSAVRA